MPMFDYRCRNCGNLFEELIFDSAAPDSDIACPNCQEKDSQRQLSAPMVATGSSSPDCYTGNCSPTSGFS